LPVDWGLRAGTDAGRASAEAALDKGVLSKRQFQNAVRGASMTPFQSGFRRLTLSQALAVYEAATPDERGEVLEIMIKKADGMLTAAPRDQEALRQRIEHAQALRFTDPEKLRLPTRPAVSAR
jgi:hypothetical protein